MRITLSFITFLAVAANGAVTLEINDIRYDSIVLKTGQSVTVQVVSNDASTYAAYVGFEDTFSVLGTFTHLATWKAAGNQASVAEHMPPPILGYYVKAAGDGAFPPVAGIHFTFTYTPGTVGATTIYLYDSDETTVLDTIDITVEPALLGSAFVYQGRLMDNNVATDGLYDIQFRLWDTPTGGTQLGSTNDAEDIDVTDGYFVVELDFGLSPYGEDSIWLEMAVRAGASGGSHTVLLPRHRLTAAPSALYAVVSNWLNLTNVPAGFADGVDDVGLTAEDDPQVGNLSTNDMPRWDGSALVSGTIRDNGSEVAIGDVPDANRKLYVTTDSDGYAIYGKTNITSGKQYTIQGDAAGNTSGASHGVFGISSSTQGDNHGVYGKATAASTGDNYGVYGNASNSGSGGAWAGYFKGDVHVEDTLEADNMPGYESGLGSLDDVPSTATSIISVELTLPASGFVILTFSGYVEIETAGDDMALGIANTEGTLISPVHCKSQNSGDHIPFCVQRVYAADAGTRTYYGNASLSSVTIGSARSDIHSGRLTAIYVPVHY